MRKAIMFVLLTGLALSNVGCILILGVHGTPHYRHVVEIDGELYFADLRTHRLKKIDAEWITETETTAETPVPVEGD